MRFVVTVFLSAIFALANIASRVYTPEGIPPTLATQEAVYAKIDGEYVDITVKSLVPIGDNTTIWFDSDFNQSTGYKIWGSIGGVEYFCNMVNSKLYLYKTSPFGEYVGAVEFELSSDKKSLSVRLPKSSIGLKGDRLQLFVDINDAIFYPKGYTSTNPIIVTKQPPLLPRVSNNKVAIVYSDTTAANFFSPKAYSQLFMAMQYQAMQAGISFDVLSEEDLLHLEKIKDYDALVFPYFAYVTKSRLKKIYRNLFLAQYYYHIPFIAAGDFLTNYEDRSEVEGNSYRYFSQLFGLKRVDGVGPVKEIELLIAPQLHPALKGYEPNEVVERLEHKVWYNYFAPVTYNGKSTSVQKLALQRVANSTYPALFLAQTGAKNIHFATVKYLGDNKLLYPLLDWLKYGTEPVRLRMTRHRGMMATRVDMDQSQYIDEVKDVDGALLKLLKKWKWCYNYVASCYINIGNNPPEERTDWSYSAPLYNEYVRLGNEIGTHSWSHPDNTNILSDEQLAFEFNASMNEILKHINPNWEDKTVRGGAIPGAPERLDIAQKVLYYLDYLSGGYSGKNAGYPSAMGYLRPDIPKVYISPNMSFDFTLIEFGVPVWDEVQQKYVPHKLTPAQGKEYWLKELDEIMHHASMPIACWPWHDYAPTTSTTIEKLYSFDMFTSVIKKSYKEDLEFVTLADVAERIESLHNAKVEVLSKDANSITVKVSGKNLGRFSLGFGDRIISSVEGWYAYDPSYLYLPQNGGTFKIHFGKKFSKEDKILYLDPRITLMDIKKSGSNLNIHIKGDGGVLVALQKRASRYKFNTVGYVWRFWKYAYICFPHFGEHYIHITPKGSK